VHIETSDPAIGLRRRYSRTIARTLYLGGVAVALALAGPASAGPPTLLTVGVKARHPTATFVAPRAASVAIYLASKPDRATDGSFLSENVKELGSLTDSEIQSGRWLDENRVDPGRYYVMLRAFADYDSCFIVELGKLDPACADGFSNLMTLVVPKPRVRYVARVSVYTYLRDASLRLTATPLGEKRPYRVCYATKAQRRRCLRGTLDGFSWSSAADDTIDASTRDLATTTTFTWYVAGKAVASKRARVH
jgi:hypothetical protein